MRFPRHFAIPATSVVLTLLVIVTVRLWTEGAPATQLLTGQTTPAVPASALTAHPPITFSAYSAHCPAGFPMQWKVITDSLTKPVFNAFGDPVLDQDGNQVMEPYDHNVEPAFIGGAPNPYYIEPSCRWLYGREFIVGLSGYDAGGSGCGWGQRGPQQVHVNMSDSDDPNVAPAFSVTFGMHTIRDSNGNTMKDGDGNDMTGPDLPDYFNQRDGGPNDCVSCSIRCPNLVAGAAFNCSELIPLDEDSCRARSSTNTFCPAVSVRLKRAAGGSFPGCVPLQFCVNAPGQDNNDNYACSIDQVCKQWQRNDCIGGYVRPPYTTLYPEQGAILPTTRRAGYRDPNECRQVCVNRCGNGMIDTGEQCGDTGLPATCPAGAPCTACTCPTVCPELVVTPRTFTTKPTANVNGQPLVDIVGGGCGPPYTYEVTGIPRPHPDFPTYVLAHNGDGRLWGLVSVNAANDPDPDSGIASFFRRLLGQVGSGSGGPNPNGRDHPLTVRVTDSAGNAATTVSTMHVNPLVADAQHLQGTGCFEEIVSSDIHITNLGPDIIPRVNVSLQGQNITHHGEAGFPTIITGVGGQILGTGNGGNGTWNNGSTIAPVGSDFGIWPFIGIGSGGGGQNEQGSFTVRADTPFNIDPNLSNNVTTSHITDLCRNKTSSPAGNVCRDDTILYIITIGQAQARNVDLTDQLHPCLDPVTVQSLAPSNTCRVQGDAIVCTQTPLPSVNGVTLQMISFLVKPRASCQIGTVITNKAHALFNDILHTELDTAETENRFCPCDDPRTPVNEKLTCGTSSSSSRSSSSHSSSASSASSSRSSSSSTVSSSSSPPSSPSSPSSSSSSSSQSPPSSSSRSSSSASSSFSSSASSLPPLSSASFSSRLERCGDRYLDYGEQCDDGNTTSGDGCSAFCQLEPRSSVGSVGLARCGDRYLDYGEQCDDGNSQSGDGCSSNCQIEPRSSAAFSIAIQSSSRFVGCGDGICSGNETVITCPTDCRPVCGDRTCSPPGENALRCSLDCPVTCGDGACAAGESALTCPYDCPSICGNRIQELGESCDDGNTVGGDGCSPRCQREVALQEAVDRCGDGIVEPPEECDDGNRLEGDGCTAACRFGPLTSTCGNGIVELQEECEIGQPLAAGVRCDLVLCRFVLPSCGDGIIDLGEECDDANALDGDGCSRSCQWEPQAPPALPETVVETPQSPALPPLPTTLPAQLLSLPFSPVCGDGLCMPPEDRRSCSRDCGECTDDRDCPAGSACITHRCVLLPPRPPAGSTGPATLAIIAGGAAAGWAWMRRRKSQRLSC